MESGNGAINPVLSVSRNWGVSLVRFRDTLIHFYRI